MLEDRGDDDNTIDVSELDEERNGEALRAKTTPKKSRTPKTDELRALLAKAADKKPRPKSMPLPGSLEAIHATYPFLPASKSPNLFGKVAPYLSNVVTKEDAEAHAKAVEAEAKAAAAAKAALRRLPEIQDAETGEALTFTKAVWSTKEGRVNLSDALDILAMGTGKSDIRPLPLIALSLDTISTSGYPEKGRLNFDSNEYTNGIGLARFSPPSSPSKSVSFGAVVTRNIPSAASTSANTNPMADSIINPPGSALGSARPSMAEEADRANLASRSLDHYAVRYPGRHPLISKFLKEGPLNISGHRFWDVKTNTLAVPAKYANSLRDEDYESDEENQVDEKKGQLGNGEDDDGDTNSYDSSAQNSAQSSLKETDKRKEKGKKKQLEPTPVEKLLANTRHWKATEEHTFRELYKHAKEHEKNKFLTGEKRHPGGLPELKKACRKIAKLKVDCWKTLAYHVADEEKKELERQQELDDCDPKRLRWIMRDHDEQRHQKRIFFRVTQYDNEISIARKMSELNLLW